jgi:hypothetical protein
VKPTFRSLATKTGDFSRRVFMKVARLVKRAPQSCGKRPTVGHLRPTAESRIIV